MVCPRCLSSLTKIIPNTDHYTCFNPECYRHCPICGSINYFEIPDSTMVSCNTCEENGNYTEYQLLPGIRYQFGYVSGSAAHCPVCDHTEFIDAHGYFTCDNCQTMFTNVYDETVQPYHSLVFPLRDNAEFFLRRVYT